MTSSAASAPPTAGTAPAARRTLAVACLAHALHDGYTDAIYVLLPVWQAQFGLDYAALASLRGIYATTVAALQIPAGRLTERWLGPGLLLAVGTAVAALGYALAGLSTGLVGLYAALMLAGAGASTQHPQASTAVSRAYGPKARGPLGIYNFAGDLGKAALPASVALLLVLMSWRHALWLLAGLGAMVALAIALLLPPVPSAPAAASDTDGRPRRGGGGFPLLFVIGMLDSGVRMGFLTYLPFILKAKGATLPTVGFALTLVFIGGAAGKFICGWLGARLGIFWTVVLTEAGTTIAIFAVLALPLAPAMLLLPLLGLLLNGTSSVLYGSVPDLTAPDRVARAFALFYTGTIGSGALAPIGFGLIGDYTGAVVATAVVALTALATLPFAFLLQKYLPNVPRA